MDGLPRCLSKEKEQTKPPDINAVHNPWKDPFTSQRMLVLVIKGPENWWVRACNRELFSTNLKLRADTSIKHSSYGNLTLYYKRQAMDTLGRQTVAHGLYVLYVPVA